jgi:hypothetical protein
MIHVIQPALSALIGLALAIYGLVHTAGHVPASDVFGVFWAALPSVVTVFVFLLGVVAIGLGLVLMTHGVQGVRRRARTVNRVFNDPRMHQQIDPDDGDYEAGYGYR